MPPDVPQQEGLDQVIFPGTYLQHMSQLFNQWLFRFDGFYTEPWTEIVTPPRGNIAGLRRALRKCSYDLFMIDRSVARYFDVYCTFCDK